MNCKPGQMAIIIGANRTPENIGSIVEVLRTAANLEVFKSIDGVSVPLDATGGITWVVRAPRPLMWRMDSGRELYFIELPSSDSFMRPISGIPMNEEVTDDLEVVL